MAGLVQKILEGFGWTMKVFVNISDIAEKPVGDLIRVAYRKGKKLFVQGVAFSPDSRVRFEHGVEGEVCIRFKLAENEAVAIGIVGGVAPKREIEGK